MYIKLSNYTQTDKNGLMLLTKAKPAEENRNPKGVNQFGKLIYYF
jgi:hypothetical protein